MESYITELEKFKRFSDKQAKFKSIIGSYFTLFENPEKKSSIMNEIAYQLSKEEKIETD